MNKYILYINEENKILEYMLPGEDNRQGTIDLSDEMSVPGLIFSYEVWDGEWYIKSNDYLRLSIEHKVQDFIHLGKGVMFNIKVRATGKRLTAVAHVISNTMTNYAKFDVSGTISISIGSDPHSDICIKQSFISHSHAYLSRKGNSWVITDTSKNGTFVNSNRITGAQQLNIGDNIYIVGYKIIFMGSFIAVNRIEDIDVHLKAFDVDKAADVKKYPDTSVFSRSPRFIEPLDDTEVEIEGPPQKEKQRKTPLWMVLGPSLTMPLPILMTVIVNSAIASRNGATGGGMYIGMLVSVVMFAGIGVMWGVIRNNYDKKARAEAEALRVNAYSNYITQNDSYLGSKLEYNRTILQKKYMSSHELVNSIPTNTMMLWNRNINHEDFMEIRIGLGYVKSPVVVKVPKEKFSVEMDSLTELPQQLSQKYEYIPDTVKTLRMKDNKILGIIGDVKAMNEVVSNMVIQLATLHSYTDVKMAFLYDDRFDLDWVRWLPHVFSNDKKNRFIGKDEASAQNTIYALTNELRSRAEKLNEEGDKNKNKYKDTYVVFCSDKSFFENEAISKYITSDEDYGFIFVLMYGTVNYLPNECNLIIEKSSNFNGIYVLNETYDPTKSIQFDTISRKEAESIARYMSGYCVSEMIEGQIPDSVDYFELLGIRRLEEWDLIKNYKRNRSYEGLPSLVGVGAGGKPLYLDIHEKKYGPHGLVAGTTGSGKSETIQTFILSLILNYSPNEVAFILIDYKGGGMANVFLNLPHLAGAITNLGTGNAEEGESVDPNQMRRALISIRSEIKRRQTLFNKYKVNHIDLYMRLYRDHKAEEPLPHLIIISDEFAELKKEQPEFIKELVSTARVGRSLGIHLILATQKPAGVVDDEIWSNSRFKICLRVQDRQDSQGMLKRPEAAYLTQTGRAYLQIGNDEIFEMFQSGYSGADYNPKVEDISTAESVDMIGIDGHSLIVKQTKKVSDETKQTQLEASIDYIIEQSEKNHIAKTRPLWLPALSDKIFLDDILMQYKIDKKGTLSTVIGLVDEPEKQNIKPLIIDFNSISNMLIAGINSSGKTNMVKTIIISMAKLYTSDNVQFYVLDFSSRTLKMFRDLPHVGDVFYPEESEGVVRTLQFISDEIADRTAIFQKNGVGGFLEYNEAFPNNILPALIVIIDNIYDFMAEYQNQEEQILKLTRDGSRYGIQFVFTVNRASDIRYKMRQNFTCMIPLRLVEKGDYLDILGKTPDFIPTPLVGRGLVHQDEILEFQTALYARGDTEAERSTNIKNEIAMYKADYTGKKAKHVPILPKDSSYAEILEDQAANMIQNGEIPIGYDIDTIELLGINDSNTYSYTIWGTNKSQVSMVMSNLLMASEKIGTDICFVNNDSGMEYMTAGHSYKVYSGYDGIFNLLVELKNDFKSRSDRRKELIAEGAADTVSTLVKEFGRKLIVIDDLSECIEIVYDDDNKEKLYPIFELFLKNGSKLGIQFISGVSGEMPVRILSRKLVKSMFEYKTGICMGGLLNSQKLFTFDLPLNVQVKKQPDNVGFTVIDNKVVKVFVPENKK